MVQSQEAVYLEFLQYDWESFQEFQDGLGEILEGHLQQLKEQDPSVVTIPAAQQQQLIDQAKLFFYCSRTGNILNLDDYYAWKRNNGDKISIAEDNEVEEQVTANEASSDTREAPQDAPYSSNYQNLVELIVSGKPVPGIKQIPDTVLSDQSSKLEAKARLKPWEIKHEEDRPCTSSDIQEMTS